MDEDVDPELAVLLRSRGFDVVSCHESGALEIGDAEQLQRATQSGRAIMTYNFNDYILLAEQWYEAGRSHSGIVLSYRQYSRNQLGHLLHATELMLREVAGEMLANSLIALDPFAQRTA